MKYAVEQDGGAVRVVLANGDLVVAKLVIGDIIQQDNNADGSPRYMVQHQVVVFVTPKAKVE